MMTSKTTAHLTLVAPDLDRVGLTAPRLLREPDSLDRLLGLLEQARHEQDLGSAGT